MITKQIGQHEIKIYDSIEDLPITRFHKYNKYLLIDSGVGSDIADVQAHIEKAIRFIKSTPEYAICELQNMQQAMHLISNEVNVSHMAFAVLIYELDGVRVTDISDSGLQDVLSKIGDVPTNWLNNEFESIKKKIEAELNMYFPESTNNAISHDYFDKVCNKIITILNGIVANTECEERIKALERALCSYMKPKAFYGQQNIEITYDKQFDEMCLMLSHKLNIKPKELTVLEYYNAFTYMKNQIKNSYGK